jgi:hypothetical protein
MGLFGKNEEKDAENAAMVAELGRLEALSLEQLAEEILLRGYGPGCPGERRGYARAAVRVQTLADLFQPARSVFGIDESVRSAFPVLISEGIQVLEHAGWVVLVVQGGDHASAGYAITRAGNAALAGGQPGRELAGTA